MSLAWLSQTSAAQGYLGGLFGPFLGMYQAMQQIGGSVGLAVLVSIAAGHGQSAALEGAAGFAVLAFVLTALAFSGRLRIAEISADGAALRPAATGSGG